MVDQEPAKFSEATSDRFKGLGRFFDEILGDAAREVGGTIADWARYYRHKNLCLIIDKVETLRAERCLDGKPTVLPPNFSLPLIEGASLEGDDTLQDLWAALIANATDPGQLFDFRKVFIETLRGLEPLDARLLALLADQLVTDRYGMISDANLHADEISRLLDANVDEIKLSLQTLSRYGCIIDDWKNTLESLDVGYGGFRVDSPSSNFRLSYYGVQLVRAVSKNIS